MDLILNNLKTAAVKIDYYRLDPSSYQMEDYTLVMDKRPVDYGIDDGGNQNDQRITPINGDFLETELRRPLCTAGVFKMSLEEFTQNNMSHWHTSTVNTTTHNIRVINDREWLTQKVSHSEVVRISKPISFNLTLPMSLQKKTVPALPKVGRDPDEIQLSSR